MSEVRIADKLDELAGWVVGADRRWVGKLGATRDDGATVVEPAYTMLGGDLIIDQRGNGSVGPAALLPLCGYVSATCLYVYGGAFVPCEQLDAQDKAQLLGMIAGAEQARTAMRAQRSGLVVAGAMPKAGK